MSAFDVYTLHKQLLHLISTLQVSEEEKKWFSPKKLVPSALQGHYNMWCLIRTLFLYLNYSGNSQWRPYWEGTNWTTTEIYGCMDKVWIKCLCCGHEDSCGGLTDYYTTHQRNTIVYTCMRSECVYVCENMHSRSSFVAPFAWTLPHLSKRGCFLRSVPSQGGAV